MLALLRIAVFVERSPIEARERMAVLREMPRDPVEQHANAELMQLRHELAELVRQAVAPRRREVARALIAPGLVERVLRDRQELHVRKAEVRDVGSELTRDLAVVQELAGRAAPP